VSHTQPGKKDDLRKRPSARAGVGKKREQTEGKNSNAGERRGAYKIRKKRAQGETTGRGWWRGGKVLWTGGSGGRGRSGRGRRPSNYGEAQNPGKRTMRPGEKPGAGRKSITKKQRRSSGSLKTGVQVPHRGTSGS